MSETVELCDLLAEWDSARMPLTKWVGDQLCSEDPAGRRRIAAATLNSESVTLQKLTASVLLQNDRCLLAEIVCEQWPPSIGKWRAATLLSDDDLSPSQRRTRENWAQRIACDHISDSLSVVNCRLIIQQIPRQFASLCEHLTSWTLRALSVLVTDAQFSRYAEAVLNSDFDGQQRCIESRPRFSDSGQLPVVFGLALSPDRLLALRAIDEIVAEEAAMKHGYTDGVDLEAARPYLSLGIRHVNRAMIDGHPSHVRAHVERLIHAIQTEGNRFHRARGENFSTVAEHPMASCFSGETVSEEYQQGILFAAVREIDSARIERLQHECIFGGAWTTDVANRAALFLHSPVTLLRQSLCHDVARQASELQVTANLRDRFTLEKATVLLAGNEEEQTERDLFLRARWKILAADKESSLQDVYPERLGETRRFPAALSLVAKDDDVRSSASFRCECSHSVVRLYRLTSAEKSTRQVSSQLQSAETGLSEILVPVGIEVQIPVVDPNDYVAWKELFRSVGIRSERRPECGRMLEASLPPAMTTQPFQCFCDWLSSRGVIKQEQNLGIHVSFQGDFQDKVRYLAFPQLFLNSSVHATPRSQDSMTLVMSKGLAHRNHDAVSCPWYYPAALRTELRVFIAAVRRTQNALQIDQCAVDAVRQTHLIASAMSSTNDRLQEIVTQYQDAMETLVRKLPTAIQRLLAADYFGATGDSKDPSLLKHLSVLDAQTAAKECLARRAREAFCRDLSAIRADAAQQVSSVVGL